jgi:hypothetical protein
MIKCRHMTCSLCMTTHRTNCTMLASVEIFPGASQRFLPSRPSFSPIYVESYVKFQVVLARARQTPRVPFFIVNWFSESRFSKAMNSVCSELIAALKLRECVGSVIDSVLSPHNGRGQQLLVRCCFCSVRLLACKLSTGSPTGDPVQLFP